MELLYNAKQNFQDRIHFICQNGWNVSLIKYGVNNNLILLTIQWKIPKIAI